MVAVVADFRTASATGTSITVDKPPGTSAPDTILVAVYCDSLGNWTAPSGTWDALAQTTLETSEVRLYAREADGTEAATFTVGNDANADLTAVCLRITGADYASLVHGGTDDDLSNTLTFGSIAAPAADSLDVLIGGWRTTVSAATPAGYSQDVYYQDRDSIAVWTDTVPSGATGSVSSSLSSSRWWAAARIALGPSGGGGGSPLDGSGGVLANGATGAGAGTKIIEASGGVLANGATGAGAGTKIIEASGGVLANGATGAGAGTKIIEASGGVLASGATGAGAGTKIIEASGGVLASGATGAGAGTKIIEASGGVLANGATGAGAGSRVASGTTGSVIASAATASGVGTRLLSAAGSVAASGALGEGTGTKVISGSGGVVASGATGEGTDAIIVQTDDVYVLTYTVTDTAGVTRVFTTTPQTAQAPAGGAPLTLDGDTLNLSMTLILVLDGDDIRLEAA